MKLCKQIHLAAKLLAISIILSAYSGFCFANQQQPNLPITHTDLISLNFNQAPIAIILQVLADSKQMNLVMSDELDSMQTIKLHNVPWHKALMIILKSAKLISEIDGNILFVRKRDELDLQLEQQIADPQVQKLDHLAITINYANTTNLLDALQQQGLLSPQGKVTLDERTNTLIVTDVKEQFDGIQTLINQLDKPLPQVHIAAHIVTMNNESLSELGIKWGYLGNSDQLLNQFDLGLSVANPSLSVGFNLAKRTGNLLNLELSALEAEHQLDIIASPNLLTSNQHTASIKQGTDIPYEVANGKNGATSIEFKQAVLGLEVTPKILSSNQLQLDLYITQNTAGRTIKRSDGGESLAIDTQEIKTQVLVDSGETVVLGGIFQQFNAKDEYGVPIVSHIPIIGNLFKYHSSKQQRRELVIFITPQLVE